VGYLPYRINELFLNLYLLLLSKIESFKGWSGRYQGQYHSFPPDPAWIIVDDLKVPTGSAAAHDLYNCIEAADWSSGVAIVNPKYCDNPKENTNMKSD